MRKFATSTLLAATLLLLTSCGEHGFDDLFEDIFGVSSSSYGAVSSSSEGNGALPSSSSNGYYCAEEECEEKGEDVVVVPDDGNGGGDVIIPTDEVIPDEAPNSNAVVGPLLQTKWNQYTPYNGMVPLDGNNPSATGCVVTATAQIMKFHGYPARGIGQSTPYTTSSRGMEIPSVNFNIAYDWNNMLNKYDRSYPGTEQQKDAIATLMYHVGISFKTNYTAEGSGAGFSPTIMTASFGYDKSIQKLERKYYNDSEWEAIIRAQLNARLPVFYSASREGGGHGFVIDGYDNTDKFHVNWGWGGGCDGYYSLNVLKPYEGRYYNSGHSIYINIKPDEGGVGSHEMALDAFTVNKTSVLQNEPISVTAKIRSAGYFLGGQAGLALVDGAGRITTVVGIINYNALNVQNTRSSTINSFFPETVNPGQYSLRMVTRTEGGEWKIVDVSDISNNIPKAIPFTVAAGEPNGGGYGLALTSFTPSKTTVSQNELFVVSSALKNVTLEAFPGGQIGTALVDNNGNIKAIIGSRNRSALNPGSTSSAGEAYSYVPSSIAPGQYKLKIAIKPTDSEEWKIAMAMPDIPNSINFTVTAEKGAPGGGYGLALTAFTTNKTTVSQSELINSFATNKTSVSQNELFTVNSALRNVAQNAFPGGQIGTALVDNNGNIKAIIGSRSRSALNSGSTSSAGDAYSYVPSAIAPGQYKLRIAVKPTDSEEWRIATMSVGDIPTSIPITVTAGVVMGGGYWLVLEKFESEKNSVSQNETFTVTAVTRNRNSDAFPGGNLGAALVDNNGNIVEVIKTINYSSLNSGSSRTSTISNCTVPNTMPPGRYKLRIVAKPTDGEWRIATLALPDVPNSIDFEVK
jgi:hypothetical protein